MFTLGAGEMPESSVVIFLGSSKDKQQAQRIVSFWKENGFKVNHKLRVLSAHKVPEAVLKAVREYEESFDGIVFIAVAGRSNALGPLISGHSLSPVINCPVLSEKFNYLDLLSSLRMPSNVPCSTVLEPENAALHAVKLLALKDQRLKKKLSGYMKKVKQEIKKEDGMIALETD